MKAFARDVLEGPKHLSPAAVVTLATACATLLGFLEFLLPAPVSLTLLYLLVVVFVAWGTGPRTAAVIALLCAFLMALREWDSIGHDSGLSFSLFWNGISRLTIFCAIGWLVSRLLDSTRRLNGLLEASSGKHDVMLTTLMDGFASIDRGNRFSEVNDTFCRMLGYAREELLGRELGSIEEMETPPEMERHLARIRTTGGDRFETRLRRKDGTGLDVEVSVSVLPGATGELISFTHEISERKLSEVRLRESEERYRTLAESSPDAIFVVNGELRIEYANSAAAGLLGRTAQSLVGVSQAELFGKEVVERHLTAARRVFETGQGLRMDERLTLPAGERWIEARVLPVRGSAGEVRSLVVIGVDIGERKRTESLLKGQRDLALRLGSTSDLPTALNALLEVAIGLEGVDSGGVYLCDPETGDLDLAACKGPLSSEFLCEAAHYAANTDRAKLVRKGQPLYRVYSELPVERLGAAEPLRAVAVLPLCREELVVGSLNLASHTCDTIPPQSRIVMEALAAQATGAIARIRAETDRHRLEQQILEITDREQARIGQELHDGLCQQLVSLAFDANSLRAELAGTDATGTALASRLAEYLDKAITEARQLSRGLFPVRLEAEGLPSALEELARTTQARSGVDCRVDCSGLQLVRNGVMAVHLYRIAQEAITNAVKHSRAKAISIRLGASGDDLELEIRDDGIGCGARATANKSGMGLHIMDYRARSIGGSLRISSGVHGGTTVSCCAPNRRPEKLPV
ncbi:MAG TPA: PAS domain S-box protein [Verrucomicrobiae bacterium]